MDKINTIFSLLSNQTPFALTRFNDGEMRGIFRLGDKVARGCQKVTESLQLSLRDAILYRRENYWIGIPCPECFPGWHKKAKELVGDYKFQTCAVVNTNRNLKMVWDELPKLLKGQKIFWIGGRDQDMEALREKTGITVNKFIPTALRGAWEKDAGRISVMRFPRKAVVMLSCGPMAEVIVHWNFRYRGDLTLIDIGSTFDPFTRGVRHRCHRFTLPSCLYCN